MCIEVEINAHDGRSCLREAATKRSFTHSSYNMILGALNKRRRAHHPAPRDTTFSSTGGGPARPAHLVLARLASSLSS